MIEVRSPSLSQSEQQNLSWTLWWEQNPSRFCNSWQEINSRAISPHSYQALEEMGPLVQSKLVSSKFVVLVAVLADCKALREKFIVYVEGTMISMDFPPWNWERCYTYSSSVRGREIMPTYRCKSLPTMGV